MVTSAYMVMMMKMMAHWPEIRLSISVGGHTEDAHQQVTDGQVQDEEISDWAHVVVLDEHQADESVPHHTQQQHQHQQVEEDVADRNPCRVDVIRQQRAVVQSEVGSIVIQGHFVHFGS